MSSPGNDTLNFLDGVYFRMENQSLHQWASLEIPRNCEISCVHENVHDARHLAVCIQFV